MTGPLGTLVANKHIRENYPFAIELDGQSIRLDVRVRGNSRIEYCEFPPLRLDFGGGAAGSVFEGQGKLKLVTHCRHDNQSAENNVLDEYAAYRIFNAITPLSYRVRLVRIRYEDTSGELRGLDKSYYGFLIEPDEQLAKRIEGEVAEVAGARYTKLDATQLARMFVFQYLIGNLDYSLVTAETDEFCCHNVDLFRVDGGLFTVPYDFDLTGLVNAAYAKPNPDFRQRRVTQRRYVGYCSSDIATIEAALSEVAAMQDEVISIIEAIPALTERAAKTRLRYLEEFFKAVSKPQKLLKQFARDCIGRDYGRPAQ